VTAVTLPKPRCRQQNGQQREIMAEIKNEKQILDRGYTAVRQMAKEMVANGADISDILFYTNQVWHEFKAAAFFAGVGMPETGMYIEQYNAKLTNKLIAQSPQYKAKAGK
jgi:hypothetical protein